MAGLRLLLQLIETLSLRLAPVVAAEEHGISGIPLSAVAEEPYYSVKRDLLQCQKRPTTLSAVAEMQSHRAGTSTASSTSSGAGWLQLSASAGARTGTQLMM